MLLVRGKNRNNEKEVRGMLKLDECQMYVFLSGYFILQTMLLCLWEKQKNMMSQRVDCILCFKICQHKQWLVQTMQTTRLLLSSTVLFLVVSITLSTCVPSQFQAGEDG